MLSAQSRLGYFREWKGDGTFEKDYFYDRRKLLLIWVPNLTQPVVGNDLKGRCPVVILDRIKRIEKKWAHISIVSLIKITKDSLFLLEIGIKVMEIKFL